jgi:hypothetical protein
MRRLYDSIRNKGYVIASAGLFAMALGVAAYSQVYIVPRGAVLYAGLTGTGQLGGEGVLYTTTGTTGGAATTAEQTLATYSLPANSLDQAGRRLRIRAMFQKASNTDTITGRLYWAGTAFSSGTVTNSGNNIEMQLEVVQTGTTNEQIAWARGSFGTTVINPLLADVYGTQSSAQTIQATCQQGSSTANDCILQDFYVEYAN